MSARHQLRREETVRHGTTLVFARWDPDPDLGDLGPMYVLDVLGVCVSIRDRDDGLYVHLDTTDTESPRLQPDLPLVVEVNNGGENHYGGTT